MDETEPDTDIARDVRLCHEALAGQIGVYEAAKAILLNHSPEDPWRRDIPETDILGDLVAEMEREIPQGPVRHHWDPEALARRDRLGPEIEERYRQKAREAFQAIISLWQPWLESERSNT